MLIVTIYMYCARTRSMLRNPKTNKRYSRLEVDCNLTNEKAVPFQCYANISIRMLHIRHMHATVVIIYVGMCVCAPYHDEPKRRRGREKMRWDWASEGANIYVPYDVKPLKSSTISNLISRKWKSSQVHFYSIFTLLCYLSHIALKNVRSMPHIANGSATKNTIITMIHRVTNILWTKAEASKSAKK